MAEGWWQVFFDEWYLDNWIDPVLYPERTPGEVDFIIEALGLAPGARVLDACCGEGRHTRELVRRSYSVVGVDQSQASLERARTQGTEAELHLMDLRDMPFESEFDAALNAFTAFGYMPDLENQRAMDAIARALKPGGGLFLDLMGREWLVRNFDPRDFRRVHDGLLLEERRYDAVAGRILATMTIIDGGEERAMEMDIRLYSGPEIAAVLQAAGLVPEAFYGGYDGSEYGLDSRRLIVVARKRG